MPFTPFHLGPGAAFKALGGKHFSFMIFGGSQVLMDLEPLVCLVRHDSVVHGPSHTVAGAAAIALLSAVIGKPVSGFVLRWLSARDASIPWTVALISATAGTFSHVGLDAVMHADMQPLWPFAPGNRLLGAISLRDLHVLCLICGIVGGGVIALRAWLARRDR